MPEGENPFFSAAADNNPQSQTVLDSNRTRSPIEPGHELQGLEDYGNAVNGLVANQDHNVVDGMNDGENHEEIPEFAEHGVMIVGQENAEVFFQDDENNNGNENENENMNNDIIVIIGLPVLDRDHSNVQITPVDCDMPDD